MRPVYPQSLRPGRDDLLKLVQTLEKPEHLVGLTHITSSYDLRDIVESGSIKATKKCPILKEKVTYAFYGRAAFRAKDDFEPTDLTCRFPSLFIFSPDKIPKPKYLFTFDSGAYIGGLMDQYTFSEMPLFDFMLSPDPWSAGRLIHAIYASTEDYLDNRPSKELTVPASNFEAECYSKIIRGGGRGVNRLDERMSTPEFVFIEPVSLIQTVRAVIMPDSLASDENLGGALKRLGIDVLPYPVVSCSRPGETLSDLRRLARIVYANYGWL